MVFTAGAVLTAAQLNALGTFTPWTPTVTATTGTFTTVSGAGRYSQIGKTVNWSLKVTITTAGTAAGAVIFTLPVTAQDTGYIGSGSERGVTGVILQAYSVVTTQGRVTKSDDTTIIASGRALWLSGTYEAA